MMQFLRLVQVWARGWALSLAAAVLLLTSPLSAQTAAGANEPAVSLRVTARMVLVDLVVTDKHGDPVTDLTGGDITLLEDGKPERIAFFSHYPDTVQGGGHPELPPLTPHVYTNRPEYRQPPGPLVLLLLDGLNTGMADQISARQQMLRYLRDQLKPGQRVTIFGLNGNLLLLQDFSSDPRVLIDALQKYSPSKSVPLSRGQPVMISPLMAENMYPPALQRLRAFNQARAVESIDDRVRLTLAALQAIARAMLGYPGRKNLVWVSSAFPFSLMLGHESSLSRNYGNDIHQTATLLADAQVAVYPVDALGLVGGNMTQSNPNELVPTVDSPDQPVFGESEMTRVPSQMESSHSTMGELAQETGGRAFYNANELDKAIANSISDGTSYYTVGYYPQNKKWDGKFRRIEIRTRRKGIKIRSRQGYYAFNSTEGAAISGQHEQDRLRELQTALSSPLPATGVTFRAQVLPSSTGQALLDLEFLVDADSVSFEEVEGGGYHHCNLDFAAFSVSAEGSVTDGVGNTVDARLQPVQYGSARQQGIPFHMQIKSVPANRELLLVVRDNRTRLLGTLAVPLGQETMK